jgi:hypothetical protein
MRTPLSVTAQYTASAIWIAALCSLRLSTRYVVEYINAVLNLDTRIIVHLLSFKSTFLYTSAGYFWNYFTWMAFVREIDNYKTNIRSSAVERIWTWDK